MQSAKRGKKAEMRKLFEREKWGMQGMRKIGGEYKKKGTA